eukprot:CAMPEP_0181250996 /NCGR_PEP_ID=MMETSP1096-20121128/46627_1 /TAXON_ID=156174 ORGANISM="Chrysochromulina ericina, Strain CCMP281" /NCGR_SAMPLE_ID=MMETSP1096 /ASSEMBLY_ACC=CAM_ASM_000453 /LENGTH=193 /DNA_ID=CAMNT_0023348521 /DNA_START=673 /DNA_END=1253 /DNA_ORIENTATION=-
MPRSAQRKGCHHLADRLADPHPDRSRPDAPTQQDPSTHPSSRSLLKIPPQDPSSDPSSDPQSSLLGLRLDLAALPLPLAAFFCCACIAASVSSGTSYTAPPPHIGLVPVRGDTLTHLVSAAATIILHIGAWRVASAVVKGLRLAGLLIEGEDVAIDAAARDGNVLLVLRRGKLDGERKLGALRAAAVDLVFAE